MTTTQGTLQAIPPGTLKATLQGTLQGTLQAILPGTLKATLQGNLQGALEAILPGTLQGTAEMSRCSTTMLVCKAVALHCWYATL